jgi:hypothetical protein
VTLAAVAGGDQKICWLLLGLLGLGLIRAPANRGTDVRPDSELERASSGSSLSQPDATAEGPFDDEPAEIEAKPEAASGAALASG